MFTTLRFRVVLLAAAALLSISSCTYDPYYSSGSVTYSSGYGYGYGYGGSNFSTSMFVSTGDTRWAYDPYTYCYYDYHRRCYYDPYLYGYYPLGYRPPVLYGVPHPHGWRPGRGYCPPPRVINNVTVVNYRNREAAYHKSRYDWAKNVRQRPYDGHRGDRRGPSSGRRDHDAGAPPRRPGGYQRDGGTRRPTPGQAPRPDKRASSWPRNFQTPANVQNRNSPRSKPSDPRYSRADGSRGPRQGARSPATTTHSRAQRPQAAGARPQPGTRQPRGTGSQRNAEPVPPNEAPRKDGSPKARQSQGALRSLGQG